MVNNEKEEIQNKVSS